MIENFWHKKEKPMVTLQGFGGGAAGAAFAGGSGPAGIEATGGIINDWQDPTSPTVYYRSHTFLNSGTFEIESVSTEPTVPDAADILIVGGGGGGGAGPGWGGGGGGGGVLEGALTLTKQNYVITVGDGGKKGNTPAADGNVGGDSSFAVPTGPTTYTATGGGYGSRNGAGGAGGSPGGPGENKSASPTSTQGNDSPFTGYGNVSGSPSGANSACGGGGAGGSSLSINDKYDERYLPGGPAATRESPESVGGQGRQNLYAGPDYIPNAYGTVRWTYGGGGGAANNDYDARPSYQTGDGTLDPNASGDYRRDPAQPADAMFTSPPNGGGGAGNCYWRLTPEYFRNGVVGYGGGGGGGLENGGAYDPTNQPNWPGYGSPADGGDGGSGTVVVRYKIADTQTDHPAIKGSGGYVSVYNGKVIHVFTTQVSKFNNSSPGPIPNTEYVIVGGGGSGGSSDNGGGGGAGAVITGTTTMPGSTCRIQVGGGAGWNMGPNPNRNGTAGQPSYLFDTGDGVITAPGGGYGGGAAVGGPGGSGGGGSTFNNAGGSTDAPTGGNDGGSGQVTPAGPAYGAGGGGGAGGAGVTGTDTYGGHGGLGVQLPSTFRNPKATYGAPGPNGEGWWVGGGGAGGNDGSPTAPHISTRGWGGAGPTGSPTGVPFAGGGNGGYYPNPGTEGHGTSGVAGTGGGGGGTGNSSRNGGAGAPGIVMMAYPI